MTDKYVTEDMLALQLENHSLKTTQAVGSLFDEKFSALSDRLDESNISRRDSVIMEVTGYPWEDREKAREAVQYAYRASQDDADTKKKVKTAGIMFAVSGILAWLVANSPWK